MGFGPKNNFDFHPYVKQDNQQRISLSFLKKTTHFPQRSYFDIHAFVSKKLSGSTYLIGLIAVLAP